MTTSKLPPSSNFLQTHESTFEVIKNSSNSTPMAYNKLTRSNQPNLLKKFDMI
jgi:hypothetical protein